MRRLSGSYEFADVPANGLSEMDTQRFEHAVELRDSGHLTEALREFASLAESATDPGEKASLLANQEKCQLHLGHMKEARDLISQALKIVPRTHVLLYIYFEDAVLCWHEGRREEALRILESLKEHHLETLLRPEHYELYQQIQTTCGVLLTELARLREARQVLEECLTFDLKLEDRGDILHNLGVCYLKIGEPDQAKGKFLETLKSGALGAYIASTHYYLGIIYSREGASAKALQEFELCLDHADEGQIPKQNIYSWLAAVSHDLGLKSDAERYERLSKE